MIVAIAVLIAIVLVVLVFFQTCVNPVIISTSEAKIKALTSRAVTSAVQTVITGSNVYDEFIEIIIDDDGNIIMIQAKSLTINKFAREITKNANQNLDLISSEGIKIPLGTLSGISAFVGLGPEITFRINSVGTIQSTFESQFTSAGINQTNHRIYLNLNTTMNIILPTASRTVNTLTHILICEAIIIGKVPDTYLNSSSLDEMLNLVPV